MKTPIRTLLALILTLVAALVVAPPVFADDPVILRDARTVAQLPTCSSSEKHRIAMITDGASASDCTTGGSSTAVICGCNGSAWAAVPTVFDYTGTHTAAGTYILDVGGSADEVTVASGSTTLLGTFIVPIAAAPPAACAAGTKGAIYYDSDINKICVCNATNYVLMNDDTTTTGCS